MKLAITIITFMFLMMPQSTFALRQVATQNNKGFVPASIFFQEQTPSFYSDSNLTEKVTVRVREKYVDITIKFFEGEEMVGESNVGLNGKIAAIYLCHGFEAFGIGNEVVARTFMRAKQVSALFGIQPEWAVSFYTWGNDDIRREDYYSDTAEPGEPSYKELRLGPVKHLFESLNFTTSLPNNVWQNLHTRRNAEGYWARNFEDFCQECESMLAARHGKENIVAGYWKTSLNALYSIAVAA